MYVNLLMSNITFPYCANHKWFYLSHFPHVIPFLDSSSIANNRQEMPMNQSEKVDVHRFEGPVCQPFMMSHPLTSHCVTISWLGDTEMKYGML